MQSSDQFPAPAPINPFLRLPTELIQHIAYLLPSNTDIAHFSSCCTSIAVQTLPEESSLWRARFKDHYNLPQDRTSHEIKVEYQIRSIVLSEKITFKEGEMEKQTLWLTVVRDMLLESSRLCAKDGPELSKTFERISQFLCNSDFLSRPLNGYGQESRDAPSDLFCAVQLCLTGLALDPGMLAHCLRTDYDIGAVYSYQVIHTETPGSLPLSLDSGLQNILHVRNFWLRHLLNTNEASFYASYTKLLPRFRPKAAVNLTRTYVLAENWLGYYSCIHPYPVTLDALEKRQTCADLGDHLTHVDCMSLTLRSNQDPLNWPPALQALIPFLADEQQRSYFRGVQKNHNSDDNETNPVRGFVEPLQEAYGGIPGWKRMCFAIYEANRDLLPLLVDEGDQADSESGFFPQETWPPLDMDADFNFIHGYEARLLPGGGMMMGQWVDMLDTTGKGPFIFWDL